MAQEINKINQDPAAMPPASLAFLGDSVFEMYIRSVVLERHKGNIGILNKYSKSYSNARSQAHMADIMQDGLTEEEMTIYKRGRNHKSLSVPKSCSVSEYRRATGLEALMGYLYLQGKHERIKELINSGIYEIDRWLQEQGSDHSIPV